MLAVARNARVSVPISVSLHVALMMLPASSPLQSPHPLQLQYGLGFDTTCGVLTAAVGDASCDQRRYNAWALDRDLSAQLHSLLRDFLRPQSWADLGWVGVLVGPGSFTGTRIGVVTARTLAQQLQVPLYGFSNLAIAAWIAASSLPRQPHVIAVSQLGQRGTIYGAIYKVCITSAQIVPHVSDQLWAMEAWETCLQEHQSDITHDIRHTLQEPAPP
ncbi:MAG TPA: tRNA (adenosine(37)-N6)-threonylcarbamoyltransferase complex dimerization subunit type 1 TsaB, partial [Stenomitos sp.]